MIRWPWGQGGREAVALRAEAADLRRLLVQAQEELEAAAAEADRFRRERDAALKALEAVLGGRPPLAVDWSPPLTRSERSTLLHLRDRVRALEARLARAQEADMARDWRGKSSSELGR